MIKGTTENGFKFTVDVEDIKDMEFIEMLADMEERPQLLGRVIERLLGKDQKKRMYDHVRDDKGRVSSDIVSDMFGEILNSVNESKEGKN